MNFPLLLQTANEDIIKRLEETTLSGTKVPPEAIEHQGASSFTQFWDSSYWFPEQASTFASSVDYLYMWIFWVSTIFFIAIVFAMVYFCVKYRRKDGKIEPLPSSSHNTLVEIAWSVGPSVLLVYMFFSGASGYFDSRVASETSEEIHVTASRWNWVFTYPNGDSSSELHLINGRPTKLIMQSNDVLHSMYIPAFRQKQDIVPGRYTYAYMVPTKTGEYRLSCTEYCGREHSKMRTLCQVHDTDEHRQENTQWIEEEYYPWKNGERIYKINCSGCHKINGMAATGPALNLLYSMKERPVMDGSVAVNEDYVLESIWYPAAKVVEGYGPVSKMNSFKGKLTQDDVNQVIAYLKYLNNPAEVAGGDVISGLRADGGGDSGTQETATEESSSAETGDTQEVKADDVNSDKGTVEEKTEQDKTTDDEA
jgi:cytochrome c oxidase subunit 2